MFQSNNLALTRQIDETVAEEVLHYIHSALSLTEQLKIDCFGKKFHSSSN